MQLRICKCVLMHSVLVSVIYTVLVAVYAIQYKSYIDHRTFNIENTISVLVTSLTYCT